jgi:hypothetical protein
MGKEDGMGEAGRGLLSSFWFVSSTFKEAILQGHISCLKKTNKQKKALLNFSH